MGNMIEKVVKEYGKTKRQRIDLNKNDNFAADEEVIIFSKNEIELHRKNINNLKKQIMKVEDSNTALSKEVELLHNQEDNLKQIIEDVTTPIYERHKEELEKKDNEIKQLQNQLKAMQLKTNQFNLELMGLSTIDMLLKHKHKKLIHNFNDEITILVNDPKINAKNTPGLPGNNNE